MSNLLQKRKVFYDFVGSIQRFWDSTYAMRGGALDELELIGDCYQVLFVNNFAAEYAIGVLDELQEIPSIYRHTLKQQIKQSIASIEKYVHDISTLLEKKENAEFIRMNEHLYQAFRGIADSLDATTDKVMSEEYTSDCKVSEYIAARLNVAMLLVDFSIQNVDDAINRSKKVNPVIVNIVWTKQETLAKNLKAITTTVHAPVITKDIRVYSKWINLKKKWTDDKFIGKNLGNNPEVVEEQVHKFCSEINKAFANDDAKTAVEALDKQLKQQNNNN